MAKSAAMFHHVVMLQPLGAGDPAVPVEADAGATTPDPAGGDAGMGSPVGVTATPAPSGATQELCEKANDEATMATLGYGLAASLVALLVFVVLEKKLLWTRGVRLGFGVGFGTLAATALAYVDPARADMFKLCLNDPGNAIYLTLGTQPVARALAFGLAPALIVTLLLCLVARRFV